MGLAAGTRVGIYEVIAPIGAGGMGEVYRARDTRLGREVALKILPDAFANDADRRARFEREAQVLAALNHPHIAQIYGIEERALALEFVDGPTLAECIAGGPLPLDDALAIALQIADALEAAHAQGIIHRDLKPANIKLRPDGTVKVLDFGLAKAFDPHTSDAVAASPSISPTMTAATRMGLVLGTAAYMSPEQAKGKPVDKRTDNWAFGCVVYETVTGQRAFPGDDIAEVIAYVITREPDWTALPPTTPAALRRLLHRCLQKDRRQRLADIGDARLEIDEARNPAARAAPGLEPAPPAPAPRWRAGVPWAIAAAAVIALAVSAGPWWRRPSAPAIERFAIPLDEGLHTVAGRGVLALSGDGRIAAYATGDRLYLRRFAEFDMRLIYGTDSPRGPVTSPAFSPDSAELVFHSEGMLRRMQVNGGAPVRVCDTPPPFGVSWDASGILVGAGAAGVLRCPATGGPAETLVKVGPGEEAGTPHMLPGGHSLLLTIARAADGPRRWDNADIVVHSLRSGERTRVIEGGTDGRYVPTGHLLYALGGTVFAVAFDPAGAAIIGTPQPVIQGVRRSISGLTGVAAFATSASGHLLYLPGPAGMPRDERVVGIADQAGALLLLKADAGAYEQVRASRDGTRLALGSDDGTNAIVWIYRLDGSQGMRRLTVEHRNRFPVWHPDGEQVVIQSNREGDLALYALPVDGAGAAVRLTRAEPGEEHLPESWSPDGRHVLFSSLRHDQYSLRLLSVADRRVMPFADVTSEEPTSAQFSPDGRWVAYARGVRGGRRTANRGVFVRPFPPNAAVYQVPQQALDFHPLWAPDGRELFFVPTAASLQIARVRFATQPLAFGVTTTLPARVTGSRTSGMLRAHDILPDGRFVGLVPDGEADDLRRLDPQLRVVLNWFEELKQRVPPP